MWQVFRREGQTDVATASAMQQVFGNTCTLQRLQNNELLDSHDMLELNTFFQKLIPDLLGSSLILSCFPSLSSAFAGHPQVQ